MAGQAPFDLTGAPRPKLGQYLRNRLDTLIYRVRRRQSRADVLQMIAGEREADDAGR